MKNFFSICLVVALGVLTTSCMQNASQRNAEIDEQLKPGQSLGIVSVPNLRDVGGYTTKDGIKVARGIAFRSNQLNPVSEDDMKRIAALGLKNDYDLRTKAEVKERPDQIPEGVQYTLLNVLADADQAGPAMLEKLMHNPLEANQKLGDGRIDSMFIKGYKEFVSLPSAKTAYRELFLSLGEPAKTPALFHCTTGKDRTGWGTAALLTLLGVSPELVMEDFLKSNDLIIPMYRKQINEFVAAGGDSLIPLAIFGVKPAYLNASFEEMRKHYGTIEGYFAEGLGIDENQQNNIRKHFLAEGSENVDN